MRLDLHTIAARMRTAPTETLLDRVTVYRADMEPAAVDLIEGELARRGVTEGHIAEHARLREETVLRRKDGSVIRCNFCERPAVSTARGWYRIFRYVPIYPRMFARCPEHGLTAPNIQTGPIHFGI